ncbi:rifin PIR protein, putative [Plasmodium reichenowi]|uniref:Rifin PIR protein, putative n=1 Tax=Plasmodium reichenowi TaxID=5854 RepID=A0A2P9DCH3_PLARE|nr:rifin PIR protein, putative [Plasmodium reichenowi]
MNVHYINILLFALPLNILVYNQRNHYMKPHTYTNRSLCECELYEPANYDNDAEMKEVMEHFNKQTQQRFHEYDDRMKTMRQKCKDKCDKEIQKIILKDKLEKQMEEQLTTLETKIDTDDIATCICEKSVADKMEKECLRCGYGLGTVAPTVGLIGSVAVHVWKPKALAAAVATAKDAAAANILAAANAAGNAKGMEIVSFGLKYFDVDILVPNICARISSTGNYANVINFSQLIIQNRAAMCGAQGSTVVRATCDKIATKLGTVGKNPLPDGDAVRKMLNGILEKATQAADAAAEAARESATAEITKEQTGVINTLFMSKQTAIIASVIAIVIIVLIMLIIYLILRYRRKKKMKKKLQYIKLLEE